MKQPIPYCPSHLGEVRQLAGLEKFSHIEVEPRMRVNVKARNMQPLKPNFRYHFSAAPSTANNK